MRNYIKLPLIYLVLLFTGSLFISSCQDDDNYYSVGDYLVSFGVVEKISDTAGNNVVVRLDSGDKVTSIVSSPHWGELSAGQRVLINFAPYDDKMNADSSLTYFGKFNNIQNILYKDILMLSKTNNDSIGNNPVIIQKTWLTGDSILNIKFSYFTQGSTHFINLVDNGSGNGLNKPYIFEFRHNDRGDLQNYLASGYVSFKLDPIKIKGQHKVYFNVRYTGYDGIIKEIPYTLNY